MNVRLRRLVSDYEAVKRLIHAHPRIEIEGVAGSPPERYRFIVHARSLRKRGADLERVDTHRVEITMPAGYPRDPPYCRMLTPVFHPNIDPATICVGDHWTPAETLANIVQRIGEMLAYQSYNVKSPRNGEAAQWVQENPDAVPTDGAPFFVDLDAVAPESEVQADESSSTTAPAACSNCGGYGRVASTCEAGHVLCSDCDIQCPSCGKVLCLTCGKLTCETCGVGSR
ncbi:MAG: ubiquitin-conjugating enzyme E2 [Coriobacteriia bacterium]